MIFQNSDIFIDLSSKLFLALNIMFEEYANYSLKFIKILNRKSEYAVKPIPT